MNKKGDEQAADSQANEASATPTDLLGALVRRSGSNSAVDEVAQELIGLSEKEERDLGAEVHEEFRKNFEFGPRSVASRLARLALAAVRAAQANRHQLSVLRH